MLTPLLFRYYMPELIIMIILRVLLKVLDRFKVRTSVIKDKLLMEKLIKVSPIRKVIRKIYLDNVVFYFRGDDFMDFLTVTGPLHNKWSAFLLHRIGMVKPKTFIDVGAHIGAFALRVGKMLPDTAVIAIEPSPLSAYLLNKSVADNSLSNVTVLCRAAYSVNGVDVNLYFSDFSTGNTIYNRHPKRPRVVLTKYVRVQTITLDNLIKMFKISRPVMLKIDAEGAERDILEGASQLIKETGELFIEIHHSTIKQTETGLCVCDICRFLRGEGFTIRTISFGAKSHEIWGVRKER